MATESSGQISLPPELVDRTIDFLYDNRQALAACALVHREWLHTSRHHLFRRISIRGDSDKLTGECSSLNQRPYITFHLRELNLSGSFIGVHICKHQLHDVLLHTPHLQKLGFTFLRLSGCQETCAGSLWNPSPISLEELVFGLGCDCVTLSNMLDILRMFGDVKLLHVVELRWGRMHAFKWETFLHTFSQLQPPSLLQVHSFKGGKYCPDIIPHVLLHTDSIHTLSSLSVNWRSAGRSGLDSLGSLLVAVGPTLTHLYMKVEFFWMLLARMGKSSSASLLQQTN